jgi:hypothetical protein
VGRLGKGQQRDQCEGKAVGPKKPLHEVLTIAERSPAFPVDAAQLDDGGPITLGFIYSSLY